MTAATASAKAEFQQDNADLFSAGYRRATECSSHPFPGVLLTKHNIKNSPRCNAEISKSAA